MRMIVTSRIKTSGYIESRRIGSIIEKAEMSHTLSYSDNWMINVLTGVNLIKLRTVDELWRLTSKQKYNMKQKLMVWHNTKKINVRASVIRTHGLLSSEA